MNSPRFTYTDELHSALENLAERRAALLDAELDPQWITDLIDAVRTVDAELIAARHVHRNSEFYPYYPESYWAEEAALEDTESLLRGPLPVKRRMRREVTSELAA